MRNFILAAIALLYTCRPLHGQKQYPYFPSKADSVLYQEILSELFKYYNNPNDERKQQVDSLVKLQHELQNKIIEYRYIFTPSYTVSDQLRKYEHSKITEISITHKTKIPSDILDCKKLETLELVNTRIKKLSKRLKALPHLTTLKVYNNKAGKPLKLAKNFTIKNLIICSEGIPKRFSSVRRLQKLDLSKNKLEKFPNLKRCNYLKELSLKENRITLSDLKAIHNTKLESLELQNNNITVVPANLGGFTNLKKLTLNYNKISSIDPSFAQLKNLEQLGLYQNNLSSIPDVLYRLPSLKEIDLYYNQIERLEAKASNWKNLEVLYLSNNNLFSLPDNLGSLTALRELYLHNNRLSNLPESLENLDRLTVLRVNDNYLNSLPNSILKLKSIENIDISNNQIQTLPDALFHLEHVNLLVLLANPWDEATLSLIERQAETLKKKEVIVHYNAPPFVSPKNDP